NPSRFNQSQVIRQNGVAGASYGQTSATTFQLTWSLGPGNHSITVVTTAIAANTSTSVPLPIPIDPEALAPDRQDHREQYALELQRLGSLSEWNLWVPLLAQPDGRRIVASGIARSAEARTVLVRNWYRMYLGRESDAGEAYFINLLLQGATEELALGQFLSTGEFYFRAPSVPGVGGGLTPDQSWVQSMYVLLLGRQGSIGELNFWIGLIPQFSHAGVASLILQSREYRERIVRS